MGTAHLTNGHHGLDPKNLDKWVSLTSGLLARPIFYSNGKLVQELHQGMIRGALQGLLELEGFNAAVSYGVTDDKLHIEVPHRVWGKVFIGTPDNKNEVVRFTHDSRHDNYPFHILAQWLEEHCPDQDITDEARDRFVREWSSSQKWRLFFESRIRRSLEPLRVNAKSLHAEADELESMVRAIETALGANTSCNSE